MSANILLKKSPKIEFQLLETGFQLIDEQTEGNSGFYAYDDLKSIELNKTWFPRVAKILRVVTWVFNGVPLVQEADSYKHANVIIRFRASKLGLWLTDSYMVGKAKVLKELLEKR